MNALLPRKRKAGVRAPTLPRDCVPPCGVSSLSCVHSTPINARCQAPFCPDELLRAAHERLAEGDTDAYQWAIDWLELCQSARGAETTRGRYGHSD